MTSDLIAKLEALDGPSREVDLEIAIATGAVPDEVAKYGPHLRRIEMRRVDPYTASLDAAIALVERVLPGWTLMLDDRMGPSAKLLPPNQISSAEDRTKAATLPIALLIALLRAKEARDGA